MNMETYEKYNEMVVNSVNNAMKVEMESTSNADLSLMSKSSSNLQLSKCNYQMDQRLNNIVER